MSQAKTLTERELRRVLDYFERTSAGVRPSPRADRLAPTVRAALAMLEQAVTESGQFNPASTQRRFRLHMSDIGAGRFLPRLMARLRQDAPQIGLDTQYLAPAELAYALDIGRIDFAFGYLPKLKGMQHLLLLRDRYVVVVRKKHPFARLSRQSARQSAIKHLEFVAVSIHSDTLRILHNLSLEERVRLTVEHFYVLPAIVRDTDLASIIPLEIAEPFSRQDFSIVDPGLPTSEFEVYLHWNRRFEHEPGNQWFRNLVTQTFTSKESLQGPLDSRLP